MKDYQNKLSQATQPAFAPAFRTRKGRGDKEYVISSPYNVGKVFEFYENIFTGIKYNEFEKTIEITKTLPWSKEKGLWTNEQTSLCIAFIDDKYRFTPRKEHIEVAITALAKKNSYHPIKQRIESQKWDGKARGERYFIDLLGCADNSYNREIAKVWFNNYEPLTPSKELMNQLADIQEDYKVEDVDKEIIDQLLNEFQIVEGWDSLSQYEQRQYVLKQLGEPLDNAQSYSDYPSAQTNCLLQVTSPNHIAYLGFNQKPTQGGKALISQKIRDHLDNDDGWKKGENPARKRLFKGGTPVSYYERV